MDIPNVTESFLSVLSVNNWRTTDQDEIDRRRLRAVKEPMRFRNMTPEHPVYSNFSVDSASGQNYQVELRSLRPLVSSCTCVDFRVNGLGTCKHVEALLRWLRSHGAAMRHAEAEGSSRIDLIPDIATGRLAVERNVGLLPDELRKLFDMIGLALPEFSTQDILAAFAPSNGSILRVSQDVSAWLTQQAQAEERIRLRRAYEQRVRLKQDPVHETKLPLLPYQREGMLHLAFTERALLADEMGLGKIIQAIAAAALLQRLGKVKRVLVVAPTSVKTEWEQQIGQLTELSYQFVSGTRTARKAVYANPSFFTVTNYEQILRDAALVNSMLKPDCVILDEAQRIKNWDSQTAQAVKKLMSRYVFILTGTPLENHIDEIYSFMSILDPHVLGPLFRFNREFYVLNANGRPESYKNLPQLRERIKPYLLRRHKADVEKELPDRTDRTVFVKMDQEQLSRYAAHEERVTNLLAKARTRALSVIESERLQRELSMMRMVCDTPYILDEKCRICPKLDEIQSLLESALSTPGVKVLVFSEWERMLLLVQELCGRMGWISAWHTGSLTQQRRRQEVQRFKNEAMCRLFLTTDTGGAGLNLQQASVVINCDLPWSPARLEQRVARAWRKNQVRNVTVINLIAEDSLEARMVEMLMHKRQLADSVLDGNAELSPQPTVMGRQAFYQQVASVVCVPSSVRVTLQRPSLEALRAIDPELGFATAVIDRLGDKILSCEACYPVKGRPVLLVVAEGDLAVVVACAERVCSDWFKGADREQQPLVEVVGRGVSEVIGRLLTRGILNREQGATRILYRRGEGLAQPKIGTDSDKTRVLDLRHQAEVAYQRARKYLANLTFDLAREPLEESVVLLARAYAVQQRLTEPQTVRQAIATNFEKLWGDTLPVVGQLLESDSSPMAVSRALMTKFGG